MADVFDKIIAIAMRSAAKAQKGDAFAGGEIIEALSSALGRSIARCADGDSAKIDTLLTGASDYIASEAAASANMINDVKSLRRRRNHYPPPVNNLL